MNENVILIILDGWGLSPVEEGNAILKAKTPVFDNLVANFPHTALYASGNEVGLESGEMGNSEVCHLNIGTGRVSQQDLPRINKSISDGSFFENEQLHEAYNWVNKNNSTLHLIGLVSDGGIHSHIDHLFALLELAKKQRVKNVAIHIITDGRDTPQKSAEGFLKKLNEQIAKVGIGKIATVSGRFYGMDRDNNWDRIEAAYNAMVLGIGEKSDSAENAIKNAYYRKETDENITPTLIDDKLIINNNDAVIFYNYRADRAKQLSSAIFDPVFKNIKRRKVVKNLFFVSFTNFGHEPSPLVKIAFFAQKIENQLAKIISGNNLSQLHVAETEKYAHVTYFFNGGEEKEFAREKRILVPSPKVKTYDQEPQMSASQITDKFLTYYKKSLPDFTVINYANPDMVGHTGNFQAAVKACEVVDQCLGRIVSTISDKVSSIIITADHGNAEQMINPQTRDIDKEHTTNPVPLILISNCRMAEADKFQISNLKNTGSLKEKIVFAATQPVGVLADIAPTIIDFLDLNKPDQMTGQSLKDVI